MEDNKLIVIPYGSYYIPESKVEAFNEFLYINECSETDFETREELFDNTWGNYKIIPA